MEFLRSILAQDEAVTVSTRVTYDLPVNPLSHILFTLKGLNETGTMTDHVLLAGLLAAITNISVEFKGTSVFSGSAKDLSVLYQKLLGRKIGQCNNVKTDEDVRMFTMMLPFGRKLFNPDECFPAVKRGDLRLIIDYAAAQTAFTDLYAQIETVELPGATPKAFLKATTIAKTLASGVGNDVDLPIGNPIVGCLLFGTTTPTGASYAATIDKVKCLVDNVESHFSECNWESLHGEFMGAFPTGPQNDEHIHRGNFTTTVEGDTGFAEDDASYLEKYAYLDFDPAGDDKFLLVTEGKSRVHLRITGGAADAARIMPVELIAVGGA
jgi:hypothetical protein